MPLDHPYSNLSPTWLRGNLHAHTTRSDGAHTPQQLIDAYAKLGYAFLAISDHDKHLPAEEAAGLDPRGMVLFSGNEITADGPHLLHVNAQRRVWPNWQRQISIDEALRDAGSFIVVNHPNWWQNFDHAPISLMHSWRGYIGVEVFNGITNFAAGSAYAADKWDMLLSAGRRVWGFAHDDTHSDRELAQGWLMVNAAERSASGILDSLRNGRFYASTGVTIGRIVVDQMRVRIETADAERIVCTTAHGARVEVADSRHIEVDVPKDVPYVRFTCYGKGERYAWTQPFWT